MDLETIRYKERVLQITTNQRWIHNLGVGEKKPRMGNLRPGFFAMEFDVKRGSIVAA